ncbi:hypothetical protein ACJIZ3_007220 [Penstemon smallii]|uniref:Coiled-coil domain-containing protein SCD2 n=1 Tax=Penstemon smallii TaxID=265156 RepID=A0ABD3S9W9_9LAMI
MDRMRPVHVRQTSLSDTPKGSASPSPMLHHRHTRSGINSNAKRPQNTKAAAQRLAQVMAHQPADDEDEEDDLLYDFDTSVPTTGIGLAGGRQSRNRSPMSVRASVDQPRSALSASARTISVEQQASSTRSPSFLASVDQPPSARSALSARTTISVEQQASSNRSPSYFRPSSQSKSVESNLGRSFKRTDHEEAQPPSARFNNASSYMEQPSSAHFSNIGGVKMVPPSLPLSVKPAVVSTVPPETTQPDKSKDKRLSLDFGTFKYKEPTDQQSSSALQDELDMLQEENDSLLEKLRLSEERFEEAEARTRQLEKQIASLGDGVSLEARLLSRKEAELQKREAALKVAAQTYGGGSVEIATLRIEAENARGEATSVMEQLHEVEDEVNSLRTMTQRMILTQEEMEEVVLKRCWLARYWTLCVRHGTHGEIAGARHEYWSSLVSRPVEFILAAGKKAKDEDSLTNNDLEEREKVLWDQNEISKKGSVESMLLVEKGLRELTSLKVEEAMAITMARKRPQNMLRSTMADELKLPIEGQSFTEAFELSQEESEDVLIKQVISWQIEGGHFLLLYSNLFLGYKLRNEYLL